MEEMNSGVAQDHKTQQTQTAYFVVHKLGTNSKIQPKPSKTIFGRFWFLVSCEQQQWPTPRQQISTVGGFVLGIGMKTSTG